MQISKIMKNGRPALLLALIIIVSGWGNGEDFSKGIKLKLSGGFRRLNIGDLNTVYLDTQIYYDRLLTPFEFVRDGSLKAMPNGGNVEIEFLWRISKRIQIGFGAGYFQSGANDHLEWNHLDLGNMSIEAQQSMNTIPILLTGYYMFSLTKNMKMYLLGGPGFYLFQSRHQYHEESKISNENNRYSTEYTSKGNGFGVHGGLGVEFRFSRSVFLFLEGISHWAKIGGLNGKMVHTGNNSSKYSSEGELWYFEYYDANIAQYLSGIRYGSRPEEGNLRQIHRLGVDLTGITIKVGIRIELGNWE